MRGLAEYLRYIWWRLKIYFLPTVPDYTVADAVFLMSGKSGINMYLRVLLKCEETGQYFEDVSALFVSDNGRLYTKEPHIRQPTPVFSRHHAVELACATQPFYCRTIASAVVDIRGRIVSLERYAK